MVMSLTKSIINNNIGFSVFDQLSYSDNSLPFGNVLSADRIRELFAESDFLFGDHLDDIRTSDEHVARFIHHDDEVCNRR